MKRIYTDHDWLDLKDGEEAEVEGIINAGPDQFTITFTHDWSMLVVNADDASELKQLDDEKITIVVTRTEDGLFATADAITDAIVQFGSI